METFINKLMSTLFNMNEKTIIEVLRRWNPWEQTIDVGIVRKSYLSLIYPYLERKEVLVLKGIRRSGKSTILKQLMLKLMEKGIDKTQILYLNLEDFNFANYLTVELLEQVIYTYKKHMPHKNKIFFFIDEIQKIKDWETWIRTYYDLGENIKFVLTGSSASLLSKELSTLLTGRNISFIIMPLSYAEFLEFNKIKFIEKYNPIEEYLIYGGFPEIVLEPSEEKKKSLLKQYFEDIVHRDIINRYSIRNTTQLLELAKYLVSTSGSKVSLNKLSKVFGLSKETLSTYVGYMQDAYLLYKVTYFSFSIKIRHDVTKLPKQYVIDNGLINATSLNYTKNYGQLFENAVFIKLLNKYDSICYWSELSSEVDFIVGKTAINVTATDKIPLREIQGLNNFISLHKGFNGVIISKSKTKENIILLDEFLLQDTHVL